MTAVPPALPRTAGRSTSCCEPSTTRSTSTCGGATSSAPTRGCGRSSRRATARRSRPRASTGSPSSRTASSGSVAASTRPTASWPATSSTRSSGVRERSGCQARRPSDGSSGRRNVRCWTGSSRRSAASRPSRRPIPKPPRDSWPVTARRRPASLRSAASSICSDRSWRVGRSWRPRWHGVSGASSPCRSTTSCHAGSV